MSASAVAIGLALAGELQAPSDPQSIVGGDVVEPGAYPEVVALRLPGDALCSGTAVAPNLVLTAAHCIDELQDFHTVTVERGDRAGTPGIPVASWGYHFAFRSDPTAMDTHDYAYVVPAEPLPEPFAVPLTTQEDWDEVMQWDHPVTLVGYGEQGAGGVSDIKRKVTVPIIGFSEEGLEFKAGADGKDTCGGDSGGAAFVTLADGRRLLAGITSRGPDPCGSFGFYSVPHPSLCWVRDSTGTDLTARCSSCDCIDTTPPELPHDGCGCRNGDAVPTWNWSWSWLCLVLLGRRRRGGD